MKEKSREVFIETNTVTCYEAKCLELARHVILPGTDLTGKVTKS